MPLTGHTLQLLHIKAEDIQSSGRRYFGVLLPQRASRRVAGVLRWCLLPQLLFPHQPVKARHGHIHFTAHFQQRQRLRQLQRDAANGAQVFGHILPGKTIAAGRSHRQLPIMVFQRNRKSVDLLLHHIGGVRHFLPHPRVKGTQLIGRKHILQRAHLHLVRDLPEGVLRLAAHPFGRRIGRSVLRVLLLQVHQAVDQTIILIIFQLRRIQVVVQMHMMFNLLFQLPHFAANVLAHLHTSPI